MNSKSNKIELYILNGWILWYNFTVRYNSIKLFFKKSLVFKWVMEKAPKGLKEALNKWLVNKYRKITKQATDCFLEYPNTSDYWKHEQWYHGEKIHPGIRDID